MDQTSDATGRWPGQVLRAALGKPTPAPCGAGDLARGGPHPGLPRPLLLPAAAALGLLPPGLPSSTSPGIQTSSSSSSSELLPPSGRQGSADPVHSPRGLPTPVPPWPQGSELSPGEAPPDSLSLSSYGTAGRAGAAGAGAAAALAPEKTTKINMGWRGGEGWGAGRRGRSPSPPASPRRIYSRAPLWIDIYLLWRQWLPTGAAGRRACRLGRRL